jgi:hypothetical protein
LDVTGNDVVQLWNTISDINHINVQYTPGRRHIALLVGTTLCTS